MDLSTPVHPVIGTSGLPGPPLRAPGLLPRVAVASLCGAVLISALALIPTSLFLATHAILPLAGFEIVAAVAAILGLLWAKPRFTEAPSLALLCIAASIAVASELGAIGAAHKIDMGSRVIFLHSWLWARRAASLALLLFAAGLSLARDRASIPLFIRGVIGGVPLVLAFAVYHFAGARVASMSDSMPAPLRFALGAVAVTIFAVSLCASGHYFIRAFEVASGTRPAAPSN